MHRPSSRVRSSFRHRALGVTDTHRKLGYGRVLLVGVVAHRRQAPPVGPCQRVDGDALQEGAEQDGEGDDLFQEPRCGHALSDHDPRVEERGGAPAEPTDKSHGLLDTAAEQPKSTGRQPAAPDRSRRPRPTAPELAARPFAAAGPQH